MRILSIVRTVCLLASTALGDGEPNGFPANPYDPYCAMSCLRSLSSLTLDCSSGGEILGMMQMTTSSECWANNTPYLTSLAWCMKTKCHGFGIPVSKLERFWETDATGQVSAGVEVVPAKWSYTETLTHIDKPPTVRLSATAHDLNQTSLVNEQVYLMQWNVLSSVQEETTRENAMGIAMLVAGFGTPIVLTVLGHAPLISTIIGRLKPYLVWPSTIGNYQVRPLPYMLGNAPTVGQSLYIAMFVILNVILTSVDYVSKQPNAWYATQRREIMAYILYRTGAFAYIMAPLIFLFATRNNILLWLTNWSHSTFLLLHRWVARVFALQAILHSVIAVIAYKEDGSYDMQVAMPYWIWGIVATVATVILTFGTGLFIRSYAYEFFLIKHIVLSVILIVACWYHAYDLYKFLGGYQIWIYCMCAIWFSDRLGRVARIAMIGPCRAQVIDLGHDYVRVEIPGVRWGSLPGKHVYVYFPTLHLFRPWENHPFSILPTHLLQPLARHVSSDSQSQASVHHPREQLDVEKNELTKCRIRTVQASHLSAGLTLYIRRSAGATRLLRASDNVLVFIEGPYPNTSIAEILKCDRLLLISGGIGITALLPFTNSHWNVKLAWSVKESARCLVDDLAAPLNAISHKDVRIGRRLDVRQLLAEEMEAGWEKVGVLVSGPGGLCDDVRAAVVRASRAGRVKFELHVEAYSW